MESLGHAGYKHYEISNFALPGKYALHNTNYWSGKHYLSLGAFGTFLQYRKAANGILPIMLSILKSILAEGKVPFEREQLSFEDRFNEYLMTSLRTMWGADLKYIAQAFGEDRVTDLYQQIEAYVDKGWMVIEDAAMRLTAKGKLFADKIAAALFL